MSAAYLCSNETEEKRLEENPEGGKSLSDRIGVPPSLFAPGCSGCECHHKDCKSTRTLERDVRQLKLHLVHECYL